MTFLKYFLPWKLPSRVNRIRYFALNQVYLVIFLITLLAILFGDIALKAVSPIFSYGAASLAIAFIIFMCISWITLAVKRLHDIDLSGYCYLVALISYIGFLMRLVIIFSPGH